MSLRFFPTLGLIVLTLTSCQTLDEEAAGPVKMTQAEFAVADTDSDGMLTPGELAQYKHREALAEFDLDDDGKIAASEWTAARPSAGDNDKLFKALDKNKDGSIAEDEAIFFITEHVGFRDEFKKLDSNGDLQLHWEEIDAGAPTALNVTLFSINPDA